ncbi:MAG: tetratricopeptide repeat protein, partial [Bacteroidota bacterium]|nr:tetratricopeptide repeat protein [Bacteroidota bacterium]
YYQVLLETYTQAGNKEKVASTFEAIREKFPNNPEADLLVADYYYSTGRQNEAIQLVKKVFANPDYSPESKMQIIYGRYLSQPLNGEQKAEALELLAILLATHADNDRVQALYGDFLYREGNYAEAAKAYKTALDTRKTVFGIWQQYFLSLNALKEYATLEKETQAALEFFPSHSLIYFFNGVALQEQGKYKPALKAYETGLNFLVENPGLEAQYYINLAEVHYRMKQFPESDRYFEKALGMDPDNAVALNNYAYYLSVRNERLPQAAQMSEKSLKISPDNPSYLDTYGWILYRQGKYDKAEEWIKKALDADPRSAEVTEHYGDVLYKLGKTDMAVEYWNKALLLGSSSANLQRKIADRKLYE